MTFTASDVLLKAASRIEEEGMWCQGWFWGDTPENISFNSAWHLAQARYRRSSECAYGALMSATVELGLTDTEFHQAEALLSRVVNDRWGDGIARWNDRVGRTAEEVAEAMRQAAL